MEITYLFTALVVVGSNPIVFFFFSFLFFLETAMCSCFFLLQSKSVLTL